MGFERAWSQAVAAGKERRALEARQQDLSHAVSMRGHDLTGRGQDIDERLGKKKLSTMEELGFRELGLKQQDLDLDRDAWDFAQNRYEQFGKRGDILGLLKSMGATQDILANFGVDVPEWFDEEFGGMFGQTQDRKSSLRATARPTAGFTPQRRSSRGGGSGIVRSATDNLGLRSVKLGDIPTYRDAGKGAISPFTARHVEGGSQFERDWNAAYDWFGDLFNLDAIEDAIRSAPGGIARYFRR